MREPYDVNDGTNEPDDALSGRLRAVRAVPPRLDRDRLMYLAGRRSAPSPRRPKLWPLLTAASWISCATVAGVLATKPAKVVTEVRIVERVVEVPVPAVRENSGTGETPRAVADSRAAEPTAVPEQLRPEFAGGDRPWTLLSSRSGALLDDEPIAVAETGPQDSVAQASPRSPATFGDLRRELLPGRNDMRAEASLFHWF